MLLIINIATFFKNYLPVKRYLCTIIAIFLMILKLFYKKMGFNRLSWKAKVVNQLEKPVAANITLKRI